MADHGEVQYTTADGNDYREHEGTYTRFLDMAFALSAYVHLDCHRSCGCRRDP